MIVFFLFKVSPLLCLIIIIELHLRKQSTKGSLFLQPILSSKLGNHLQLMFRLHVC